MRRRVFTSLIVVIVLAGLLELTGLMAADARPSVQAGTSDPSDLPPPTLIFHGTIDDTVPIDQADRLAEKLKSTRVPYRYDRLEGWPHAMDLAEVVNQRCQRLMMEFFKKHLLKP